MLNRIPERTRADSYRLRRNRRTIGVTEAGIKKTWQQKKRSRIGIALATTSHVNTFRISSHDVFHKYNLHLHQAHRRSQHLSPDYGL